MLPQTYNEAAACSLLHYGRNEVGNETADLKPSEYGI